LFKLINFIYKVTKNTFNTKLNELNSKNNNITTESCKIEPLKIYPDAYLDKARLIEENHGKAGIYR